MDTTEQLNFIVYFANLDFKKGIREGDWINLQDDFRRFFPIVGKIFQGSIQFHPHSDPEYEKYPKDKFLRLQGELQELLLTKTKRKSEDGSIRLTHLIEIKVSYSFSSNGDINFLVAVGHVRDLFLQRVINLLLDPEASSNFRQCPECKKIFLRVRRQVYCSPPCADKANKRVWLKTPKGKRYLQKTKKKRRGKK